MVPHYLLTLLPYICDDVIILSYLIASTYNKGVPYYENHPSTPGGTHVVSEKE